jgi:hypothetical protein
VAAPLRLEGHRSSYPSLRPWAAADLKELGSSELFRTRLEGARSQLELGIRSGVPAAGSPVERTGSLKTAHRDSPKAVLAPRMGSRDSLQELPEVADSPWPAESSMTTSD